MKFHRPARAHHSTRFQRRARAAGRRPGGRRFRGGARLEAVGRSRRAFAQPRPGGRAASPSVAPSPTDSTVSVPATPTPPPRAARAQCRCGLALPIRAMRLRASRAGFPELAVEPHDRAAAGRAPATWHRRGDRPGHMARPGRDEPRAIALHCAVGPGQHDPSPARPDRANLDEPLHSLSISYAKGPIGGTIVARVEIVVEWLGSDGQLLGSESVVPTSYRYGSAGPILPEGCHTDI